MPIDILTHVQPSHAKFTILISENVQLLSTLTNDINSEFGSFFSMASSHS
jgi:hypothetical protein